MFFSDRAWGVHSSDGNQDIALFRFASSITFTSTIYSIRMPSMLQRYDRFHGWPMQIVGWGGAGDGLPRFLQYGDFRVITNTECSINTQADGMCALADPNTITSTQGGDSGGPWFIFEGAARTPTIIGVHRGRRVTANFNFHRGTLVGSFLGIINGITGIPIRSS
jgi:hypothetical protein